METQQLLAREHRRLGFMFRPAVPRRSEVSPKPAYNAQKIVSHFLRLVGSFPGPDVSPSKVPAQPVPTAGRRTRAHRLDQRNETDEGKASLRTTERLYRESYARAARLAHARENSWDSLARSATPTIDPNSSRLAARMNVTPIRERYPRILAERKVRLEKARDELRSDRERDKKVCTSRIDAKAKTGTKFSELWKELQGMEQTRHALEGAHDKSKQCGDGTRMGKKKAGHAAAARGRHSDFLESQANTLEEGDENVLAV